MGLAYLGIAQVRSCSRRKTWTTKSPSSPGCMVVFQIFSEKQSEISFVSWRTAANFPSLFLSYQPTLILTFSDWSSQAVDRKKMFSFLLLLSCLLPWPRDQLLTLVPSASERWDLLSERKHSDCYRTPPGKCCLHSNVTLWVIVRQKVKLASGVYLSTTSCTCLEVSPSRLPWKKNPV